MDVHEITAAGVSEGRAAAIADALATARVEVPEEVRRPIYWILGLASYATRLAEVNLPGLITVASRAYLDDPHLGVLAAVKGIVADAPDVLPNAPSRAAVLELVKLVMHVADWEPLPKGARVRHSTEV